MKLMKTTLAAAAPRPAGCPWHGIRACGRIYPALLGAALVFGGLPAAVATAPAAAAAQPAVAAANPVVDEAVAELNGLGLTQLSTMPSGRVVPPAADTSTNYGYRSYDDYVNEMQALAAANPGRVEVRTAPYRSIEGRVVPYLEITNNVHARDGKPVFFMMGLIHGNEWPGAEDSLEFAYDVANTAKTNPKVKALLDHVRLIDMPVVNPDGLVHFRRHNCDGPVTPPATCPTSSALGVDMNRNYPFGWGSNIDVTFTDRGSGPGSEPEVKNTMAIVQQHQVVDLITNHTNEHAIFYPPLDLAAGGTPDLNNGYQTLALAFGDATKNGYANIRDSAHDYQTSGETIDWAYYATRSLAFTFEVTGGSPDCRASANPASPGKSASAPNYANCTTPDYTGTPGPTSTPSETQAFGGHPLRNAYYLALVYASLAGGHSVIDGTAPPGTTLQIDKHFDLYTAPIQQDTTPPTTDPPRAIPTDLESTMVVPANGHFHWDVNPSVRPNPPFQADGEHTGPNGFLGEAWTFSCRLPHGPATQTRQITIDQGQEITVHGCAKRP